MARNKPQDRARARGGKLRFKLRSDGRATRGGGRPYLRPVGIGETHPQGRKAIPNETRRPGPALFPQPSQLPLTDGLKKGSTNNKNDSKPIETVGMLYRRFPVDHEGHSNGGTGEPKHKPQPIPINPALLQQLDSATGATVCPEIKATNLAISQKYLSAPLAFRLDLIHRHEDPGSLVPLFRLLVVGDNDGAFVAAILVVVVVLLESLGEPSAVLVEPGLSLRLAAVRKVERALLHVARRQQPVVVAVVVAATEDAVVAEELELARGPPLHAARLVLLHLGDALLARLPAPVGTVAFLGRCPRRKYSAVRSGVAAVVGPAVVAPATIAPAGLIIAEVGVREGEVVNLVLCLLRERNVERIGLGSLLIEDVSVVGQDIVQRLCCQGRDFGHRGER
ncbi:hypothetical protein PG996_013857 [Apiospora saccharicola]|uniref:Uncharacterized protein n=1 Tax=Apiospora saccharicola TaxID=335842 RepID=A0ABR1TGM8_9PEZI